MVNRKRARMSDSILDVFREDSWRLGDCQVIPYDRRRVDIFGTGYLLHLYNECLLSRPTDPYGVLSDVFCGMTDLSADAICSYLANKPISLLCVHTSATEFTPAGFCWPTEVIRAQSTNSAFCAFAFFRDWWGTPECTVLGMLGIAYLFESLVLTAIHGQRYATNEPAARWMRQFGAKDIGVVPYLLRSHDGGLEACTVSTLLRADFEAYTRKQLITLAGAAVTNGQVGEQPQRREPASPAIPSV